MANVSVFIVFSIFLSLSVHATTYIPVAIEKQLSESTMAFEGKWVGSESKKLASGEIVTENWFVVEKSTNPKIKEFLVNGELPVLVIGGTVGDDRVVVEGAPNFKRGEEVLLFVRKNQKGNWLQGLGIGKYEVKKIGSRKIYVSSIFPSHPIMGQIEDTHFRKLVKKIKGVSFDRYDGEVVHHHSNRHTEGVPSSFFVDRINDSDKVLQKKRLGRKIASIGEEDDTNDKIDGFGVFWLVLVLAVLGGATQIYGRKRRGMGP